MNRMITLAAATALLVCVGTAWASIEPAGTSGYRPSTAARHTADVLKAALADLSQGDDLSAAPELDAAIASKGFGQLPASIRYPALQAAGAIALQDGYYAKAHRLAVRATGFDRANSYAWMVRLFSAFSTNDYRDAGQCMAVVARRWPDQLDNVHPEGVLSLHHQLRAMHDDDVDRAMLNALFDAHWQGGRSAYDTLWRDMALMDIQHHDMKRAAAVAGRIRSAQTALSMRVDKRFDPITRAHPEAFDVDRLLAAQIKATGAWIKARPSQLEPVERMQELLLVKTRYSDVLSVSNAAVARAGRGDGSKAYTDFGDTYNWVLNQRALALAHEGRWHDAVREMTRAAQQTEHGSMNVSQSINLAGMYTDLGEPDKAAAALNEPGDMSPYGHMQFAYVKLQIALEKHDTRAIARHMAYLRKHRAVDLATWQRVLLKRDDLDAAAALLIRRLKNPDSRNQALIDMQHYAQGSQTRIMKTMTRRWNAVTSRPDVRAELNKVGRIERFDILSPSY